MLDSCDKLIITWIFAWMTIINVIQCEASYENIQIEKDYLEKKEII